MMIKVVSFGWNHVAKASRVLLSGQGSRCQGAATVLSKVEKMFLGTDLMVLGTRVCLLRSDFVRRVLLCEYQLLRTGVTH